MIGPLVSVLEKELFSIGAFHYSLANGGKIMRNTTGLK